MLVENVPAGQSFAMAGLIAANNTLTVDVHGPVGASYGMMLSLPDYGVTPFGALVLRLGHLPREPHRAALLLSFRTAARFGDDDADTYLGRHGAALRRADRAGHSLSLRDV